MPCEHCPHCLANGYKKPEDKRNPDIQELYDLGISVGYNSTRQSLQRFAIKRLIQKLGKPEVISLVKYTGEIKNQMYAPQIFNFLDLEQKLEKVMQHRDKFKRTSMPETQFERKIVGYKKIGNNTMEPIYEEIPTPTIYKD